MGSLHIMCIYICICIYIYIHMRNLGFRVQGQTDPLLDVVTTRILCLGILSWRYLEFSPFFCIHPHFNHHYRTLEHCGCYEELLPIELQLQQLRSLPHLWVPSTRNSGKNTLTAKEDILNY